MTSYIAAANNARSGITGFRPNRPSKAVIAKSDFLGKTLVEKHPHDGGATSYSKIVVCYCSVDVIMP